MKRRDFLIGAATGASAAGVMGVAGTLGLDALRKARNPAPSALPASKQPATPASAGGTTQGGKGATPGGKAHPDGASQARQSFSQQGEDLILYSLLYGVLKLKEPTYLDIGAGDPVQSSNTYLFYWVGGHGVLVEPNPALVEKIKVYRPKDVVVNAGVGVADATEADYYIIRDRPPLNTFSPEFVALLRKQEQRDVVEKVVKMPLISINRLIAEKLGRAPDLLSIDVEGLDFAILRSLDFARYRPAVICAETIRPGQRHDNTPIARLLASRGYRICGGSLINTIFVDRKRVPV